MRKKYYSYMWRSVCHPACHLACPPDSWSRFCRKKCLSPSKNIYFSLFHCCCSYCCQGEGQPSPQWQSQTGPLFTDADYVIMSLWEKNVTSTLSRMFGRSGSQSLHFTAASIWLWTVSRFRLTGGHLGNTLETHRCHHHDVTAAPL